LSRLNVLLAVICGRRFLARSIGPGSIKGKKEIKSSVIGELVMKKLKKLDNIAYIRFASVYKEFKDVNDFKSALKEI